MVTSGSFRFSEFATAKYFFAPKCLQTPQHCYFERRQGLKRLRKPNSNSGRDPGQTGERSRKKFWGGCRRAAIPFPLKTAEEGKRTGIYSFFPFPLTVWKPLLYLFFCRNHVRGWGRRKNRRKGGKFWPASAFPCPT